MRIIVSGRRQRVTPLGQKNKRIVAPVSLSSSVPRPIGIQRSPAAGLVPQTAAQISGGATSRNEFLQKNNVNFHVLLANSEFDHDLVDEISPVKESHTVMDRTQSQQGQSVSQAVSQSVGQPVNLQNTAINVDQLFSNLPTLIHDPMFTQAINLNQLHNFPQLCQQLQQLPQQVQVQNSQTVQVQQNSQTQQVQAQQTSSQNEQIQNQRIQIQNQTLQAQQVQQLQIVQQHGQQQHLHEQQLQRQQLQNQQQLQRQQQQLVAQQHNQQLQNQQQLVAQQQHQQNQQQQLQKQQQQIQQQIQQQQQQIQQQQQLQQQQQQQQQPLQNQQQQQLQQHQNQQQQLQQQLQQNQLQSQFVNLIEGLDSLLQPQAQKTENSGSIAQSVTSLSVPQNSVTNFSLPTQTTFSSPFVINGNILNLNSAQIPNVANIPLQGLVGASVGGIPIIQGLKPVQVTQLPEGFTDISQLTPQAASQLAQVVQQFNPQVASQLQSQQSPQLASHVTSQQGQVTPIQLTPQLLAQLQQGQLTPTQLSQPISQLPPQITSQLLSQLAAQPLTSPVVQQVTSQTPTMTSSVTSVQTDVGPAKVDSQQQTEQEEDHQDQDSQGGLVIDDDEEEDSPFCLNAEMVKLINRKLAEIGKNLANSDFDHDSNITLQFIITNPKAEKEREKPTPTCESLIEDNHELQFDVSEFLQTLSPPRIAYESENEGQQGVQKISVGLSDQGASINVSINTKPETVLVGPEIDSESEHDDVIETIPDDEEEEEEQNQEEILDEEPPKLLEEEKEMDQLDHLDQSLDSIPPPPVMVSMSSGVNPPIIYGKNSSLMKGTYDAKTGLLLSKKVLDLSSPTMVNEGQGQGQGQNPPVTSNGMNQGRIDVTVKIDESYCVLEDGMKRWKCRQCSKSYTTKHNLATHILDHNGIKPHCCMICGKFFKQISHLNTHMLTHGNIKPHSCHICGKAFTQISHVKRHLATHMAEKPYRCDVCGRGFAYPSELKMHKEKHVGQTEYSCNECGKGFGTAKKLDLHMCTHRSKEDLTCKECNKTFQYPSQLKDHAVKHSGKRPHICTECGMDFMKEHHLKSHQFIHTGLRPYSCHVCQRTFNQRANMQRHLLTHDAAKNHACQVCDKKFSQIQTLKAHMIVHSDQKPHECAICGKEFARLINLTAHMHTHEENKPFVCHCGSSFTLKGNFSRHQKVKHGIELPPDCQDEGPEPEPSPGLPGGHPGAPHHPGDPHHTALPGHSGRLEPQPHTVKTALDSPESEISEPKPDFNFDMDASPYLSNESGQGSSSMDEGSPLKKKRKSMPRRAFDWERLTGQPPKVGQIFDEESHSSAHESSDNETQEEIGNKQVSVQGTYSFLLGQNRAVESPVSVATSMPSLQASLGLLNPFSFSVAQFEPQQKLVQISDPSRVSWHLPTSSGHRPNNQS